VRSNSASTYPFDGAQGAVPTLELLTLGIVLPLRLGARVELQVSRPAMLGLVDRRKALIARGGPDGDRGLRHGGGAGVRRARESAAPAPLPTPESAPRAIPAAIDVLSLTGDYFDMVTSAKLFDPSNPTPAVPGFHLPPTCAKPRLTGPRALDRRAPDQYAPHRPSRANPGRRESSHFTRSKAQRSTRTSWVRHVQRQKGDVRSSNGPVRRQALEAFSAAMLTLVSLAMRQTQLAGGVLHLRPCSPECTSTLQFCFPARRSEQNSPRAPLG
jgi:hypothetical protein